MVLYRTESGSDRILDSTCSRNYLRVNLQHPGFCVDWLLLELSLRSIGYRKSVLCVEWFLPRLDARRSPARIAFDKDVSGS